MQYTRKRCIHPLFDADGLNGDESSGVSGLEATELVHGGLLLVVETLVGGSALDDDVALVKLEADDTVDGALARGDGADDKLTLGREPVAVVEDAAELDGDELVAQGADVPVEGEALEVDVRGAQDRRRGRLVASARLDADETVLDDVDAADTVLARERVEGEEDLDAVGVGLVASGDLDGETALELDGNALGLLGRVFGGDSEFPHIGRRGGFGVLEDAGLVGDVEQVLVGRPGLGGGLSDGDVLFGSIGEESLTTRETVVELCNECKTANQKS